MFPGVLAMTVLFTSIFSAVSIVWDREFGFLREMMVAPVRRGAVIFGKAAGGGVANERSDVAVFDAIDHGVDLRDRRGDVHAAIERSAAAPRRDIR